MVNEVYNPAFIYCDAGSGELQIETLHKYGDEHPETRLKQKVKRWQFSQTIDVLDPGTMKKEKKPMKPFMVNQLQIMFERNRLILSPYDNVLYKQLIDYVIERMGANKQPIFTSKNEHFIDALGLCILGFVLEFPEIGGTISNVETKSIITESPVSLNQKSINSLYQSLETSIRPSGYQKQLESIRNDEDRDKAKYIKVNSSYRNNSYSSSSGWGSRASRSSGRTLW